jgi:purine-binding chemotaxis protein CheW
MKLVSGELMSNIDKYTIGLITLREEVLVAIDFRVFFSIEGYTSKENRLIIINDANSSIALLVDSVIDIKDFADSDIQDIPSKFKDRHIVGVIEIENDELISIVDKKEVVNLLNHLKEDDVIDENNIVDEKDVIIDEDSIELVIFNVGSEEYALDIDSIEEIINLVQMTPVYATNELLQGIINLRGDIIPVISVDNHTIGDGLVGESTKKLMELYQKEVLELVSNRNNV